MFQKEILKWYQPSYEVNDGYLHQHLLYQETLFLLVDLKVYDLKLRRYPR